MAPYVEWKGTDLELGELKVILERNCRLHENQTCDDTCAHRMMGDQKLLDRLLFARRKLSASLWAEEMARS